jgi:hypothetical protein
LRELRVHGVTSAMILVVVLTALSACGTRGYGTSAASGSQTRIHLTCRQARAVFRKLVGSTGPLPCDKATRFAESQPLVVLGLKPQKVPGAPTHVSATGASTSPSPPANARQIMSGPEVAQWQQSGTSITSLWMDLEAGMLVQVESAVLNDNPNQGEIFVMIIDENTNETSNIGTYGGGTYPTPQQVGSISLTGVSGSLATNNMLISFSYTGGSGTFNPETSQFTMSST